MPLTAGTRFGPHEILSVLGAGGMGQVYRARDSRLNRDVALKVLPAELAVDPTRRQRFEIEAALNHPNIVSVYVVGDGYIVSWRAPTGERFSPATIQWPAGARTREFRNFTFKPTRVITRIRARV